MPATQLVTHRYILKVGVDRGKTPGGGDRLTEGGVYASGRFEYLFRQGIDVGALQFSEGPVIENQLNDLMLWSELRQHLFVGFVLSGLSLLRFFNQLHPVKKHFAQLFG